MSDKYLSISEGNEFREDGITANLPNDKIPGRMLIALDSGALYYDTNASRRIQIGMSAKQISAKYVAKDNVDQSYNGQSDNPQSGKAIAGILSHYLPIGEYEWEFDGGDSTANIEIDLVVDNQMSDESENPVQNKVVKQKIDELEQNFTKSLNSTEEEFNNKIGNLNKNEVINDTNDIILFNHMETNNGQFLYKGKRLNSINWLIIDLDEKCSIYFGNFAISPTNDGDSITSNNTDNKERGICCYHNINTIKLKNDNNDNVYENTQYYTTSYSDTVAIPLPETITNRSYIQVSSADPGRWLTCANLYAGLSLYSDNNNKIVPNDVGNKKYATFRVIQPYPQKDDQYFGMVGSIMVITRKEEND